MTDKDKNGVVSLLSSKVLPFVITLIVGLLAFQGNRIINMLDELSTAFQEMRVDNAASDASQQAFEREVRGNIVDLKTIATSNKASISDHEIRIQLLEKRG